MSNISLLMTRIRTFQSLVVASVLLYILWMALPHIPRTVLGEIDPNGDNGHGLPLLLMRHSHFPSWHFVAGRRITRLVRDGEVPFIR